MPGKVLRWALLISFLAAQQPQYNLILDQTYVRATSSSAPDSVNVYLIVQVRASGAPADTLISSNFPFFYNMALDFSGARVIHEKKFSNQSKPNYYDPITYPFTVARVNVTVRRKIGFTNPGDTLVRLINQRDTILGLRVPVRACGPTQQSILVWDTASLTMLNSQLQSIKPRINAFQNDTFTLCPTLGSLSWGANLPTSLCVGDTGIFQYVIATPLGPSAASPDSFVVFTQRVSNGLVQSYGGIASASNLNLAFSVADSYDVWVRYIERKCGCYRESSRRGVRVHPRPAVGQIVGPDTVYVGYSMAAGYVYSVNNANNFSKWRGKVGGGGAVNPSFSSPNGSPTAVSFDVPIGGCRADTLWAIYQNASGCGDSTQKVVAVCPCGASGNISASRNRVCQGEKAYLYLSGFVGDSVRWEIDTTGMFAPVTAGSFPNSLTYETPPLSRTVIIRSKVYRGYCFLKTNADTITVDTFRVQTVNATQRLGSGGCVGDTVWIDTSVVYGSGNIGVDSLLMRVREPGGDTVYYADRLWFVPQVSGTYKAWVEVYGGVCGGRQSGVVNINVLGRPPMLSIIGPDTVYVPSSGAIYEYNLPALQFSYASVVWYHRIGGGGTTNPPNGTPTMVSFPAPPGAGRVDTLVAVYQIQGNPCPQFSSPKFITVLPCRSVPPARALTPVVCAGQRGAVEIPLPFAVDSLRWQFWNGTSWQDIPDNVGTGATATLYITPPLQAPGIILRARVHAGPCEVYSQADTIGVSGQFLDRNLYSVQTPICAGDTSWLQAGGSGVWITPNGQGTFTDTLDPQAGYVSAPNDPNPVRVCWVIRSQDLGKCREISKDTLCLDITILPAQASGSFSLNPSPYVACPGEPIPVRGVINQGLAFEWLSTGTGYFYPSSSDTIAQYIPGFDDVGKTIYIGLVIYGTCGYALYVDSVAIQPGVAPQILGPNQICQNTALRLRADRPASFDSLRWWQGQIFQVQSGTATFLSSDSLIIFSSLNVGTYHFTLQGFAGICTGYDEISVEVLPVPQVSFTAEPRVTTLNNPTITFTNNSQGATAYIWNFGDPNQPSLDSSRASQVTFNYLKPGTYSVVLFGQNQQGCGDIYVCTDCIVILPRKVFLPNAFSPNGDGKNDIFRVLPVEEGTPFTRLEVYDRWGQLVFAGDNLPSWDGRGLDGKPLDAGTYTYKAFILVPDEGLLSHTGVVHIVR